MSYVSDLRELVGHRPLILSGACGVLVNPKSQVLLQQRNEPAKRFGLIGGLMELGETPAETLVREAREETGLVLDPTAFKLLGVYAGGGLSTAPNGDQYYSVTTAYLVENVSAAATITDGESLALGWFALDDLPANLVPRYAQVLADWAKR